MSGNWPSWSVQDGFDVRLCWGPAGVQALGEEVGALVIVDILRFTTALDVAVGRGAHVLPSPWPGGSGDHPAHPATLVEVADLTAPRRVSLSPASLAVLRRGERVVLPSANGSHCSALAAGLGVRVVGGSLRNARAVSEWLIRTTAGRPPDPIAVVPCGERWPDASLRPAVEDLLGAGAIVTALSDGDPARSFSPEAAAAGAAFRSARSDLVGTLAASASGRELEAKGSGGDIGWAAALDVSRCVPVLAGEGAYVDGSR